MEIVTTKLSRKSSIGSDDENTIGTTNAGPASTHHAEAVSRHRATYGPSGFRGLFSNHYVIVCAAFSILGGLIFGGCLYMLRVAILEQNRLLQVYSFFAMGSYVES
jgi:hypothetical protein